MQFRKSTQTIRRPYAQVDDKQFVVNRGKFAQGIGGRGVLVPHEAYWRDASCKEVDCVHWLKGWMTTLDLSPMQDANDVHLNQARYNYIRDKSGRAFAERWDGSIVHFDFTSGQTCFRHHRLPLERDPMFLYQSSRGGNITALDYDQWFDTFNETSYWLNQRIKNG